MAKYVNDVVNEFTPRMGNSFSRWIGSSILSVIGWKLVGEFPREKKLIFIGAPHTSNWDLIIALAAMMSIGLKCSWMMKKEAFFWPLDGLWRSLGGVPIDRSSKSDITTQMAQWFNDNELAWLGLTPEGTRSKVDKFKKGYLRMAYAAGVPVFIIAINGPTKEVVLDKVWDLTYDTEVDNRKIKDYYDKNYTGIRAEKS
ncbi:MAG: 1-acyl-sn-glycerol-3-phosphate acyltransferase [Maricaulaceae bacterium]